jgi:hypothetical protein
MVCEAENAALSCLSPPYLFLPRQVHGLSQS